jgi:hypothetical protein
MIAGIAQFRKDDQVRIGSVHKLADFQNVLLDIAENRRKLNESCPHRPSSG